MTYIHENFVVQRLYYNPLYIMYVCTHDQLRILLHTIFERNGTCICYKHSFYYIVKFTGMVTYAHLQAILWMGTKFINSNVSISSHTVADAPNQS